MIRRPPGFPSFPSRPLSRPGRAVSVMGDPDHPVNRGRLCPKGLSEHHTIHADGRLTTPLLRGPDGRQAPASWEDRKSTRLNSSHANISYAVFCLKKKQKIND